MVSRPHGNSITWTAEMDAALIHMSSGPGQLPFEVMAERIGVSLNTLLERQKTLGIFRYRGRGKKPLDWTEEMIAVVRTSWPDPSVTVREIADRLKISTSAVAKKAAELGFSRKTSYERTPDERDREVLRYIARHPGCSASEIITGTGLEPFIVYPALRRLRASNRCRRRDKPTYFANTVWNSAGERAALERVQLAA